jgi:hypothetical protein
MHTGSRLLRDHRLSAGPVAANTTDDFTADDLIAGPLTWSLADGDTHLIHGTFHTARSSVAPDRIQSG